MDQVLFSHVMHVDVRSQTSCERLCMSLGQWVETHTLGLYYSILYRMVFARTSVIGYQQSVCHTSRAGLVTAATQCLLVLAGRRPVCCAGCAAPVMLISKDVWWWIPLPWCVSCCGVAPLLANSSLLCGHCSVLLRCENEYCCDTLAMTQSRLTQDCNIPLLLEFKLSELKHIQYKLPIVGSL